MHDLKSICLYHFAGEALIFMQMKTVAQSMYWLC